MARNSNEIDSSGYPVYTGSQRILRFVSLVYLGWYVLSAAGAVALTLTRFLLGWNVLPMLAAGPISWEELVTSTILFIVDVLFNCCFAVCAWMTSNHPSIAKRFRIFAVVVFALTLARLVYAVVFAQAASVFSGFYSCVVIGFLLYLANQIHIDCKAGLAVDFQDLAKTPRGKHLRTDTQLRRAIESGELLPCSVQNGK